MLKSFFSKWSNNTDSHLVNGKSIGEEFELLKSSNPNYGSLLKISTKEIKPFSLCPTADIYLQKRLDNLNSKQVAESEPRINTGISK